VRLGGRRHNPARTRRHDLELDAEIGIGSSTAVPVPSVIGGTGIYANARVYMNFRTVGESTRRLEIHLIP
jgi:hypothetical protein